MKHLFHCRKIDHQEYENYSMDKCPNYSVDVSYKESFNYCKIQIYINYYYKIFCFIEFY